MLFRTSKKIFIHVDCDSFFASCEVLRNPNLKGKYVCVWWDIVVASSYEAKSLWVKVGTPLWEAKKILKQHGHYFPVDIDFYTKVSIELMNYLKKNTLYIEPFSIDEAFCEITWLPELYGMSVYEYIKKFQSDIRKYIGIPVSIWVSNTRIRAKIFSKIHKPNGIFIGFESEFIKSTFQKLPLKDIPFIGRKSQEKLRYNCSTIYDYIGLGFWDIKARIGKVGTDLRLELLWVDIYVVKKTPVTKSISRTRSFNHQMTSSKDFVKAQLIKNFDRALLALYKWDFEVRHIAIMFRDKQFKIYMYDQKIPEHTNMRKKILNAVWELFEKHFDPNIIYRSTWIYFYELRSYLPRQMNIFEKPLRGKENHYELIKKIHAMNMKLWEKKISFGFDMLGDKEKHSYKIRL